MLCFKQKTGQHRKADPAAGRNTPGTMEQEVFSVFLPPSCFGNEKRMIQTKNKTNLIRKKRCNLHHTKRVCYYITMCYIIINAKCILIMQNAFFVYFPLSLSPLNCEHQKRIFSRITCNILNLKYLYPSQSTASCHLPEPK